MAKRVRFIEQAARVARIPNVTACCARAEALGHDTTFRESFDVVTARAVAEARVLAELCLPYVSVGGLWIAAKGPAPLVCRWWPQGAVHKLSKTLLLRRMRTLTSYVPHESCTTRQAGDTGSAWPRLA
jgi:16S rRNA (guanine527-N7)-methyltransferase